MNSKGHLIISLIKSFIRVAVSYDFRWCKKRGNSIKRSYEEWEYISAIAAEEQ